MWSRRKESAKINRGHGKGTIVKREVLASLVDARCFGDDLRAESNLKSATTLSPGNPAMDVRTMHLL